jgi:hypothetical protein
MFFSNKIPLTLVLRIRIVANKVIYIVKNSLNFWLNLFFVKLLRFFYFIRYLFSFVSKNKFFIYVSRSSGCVPSKIVLNERRFPRLESHIVLK